MVSVAPKAAASAEPASPRDTHAVEIRSAEPGDAAAISAMLNRVGTFEGTLQMPDVPIASRIEALQKLEPGACRVVAVANGEVVGTVDLRPVGTSPRRAHVRGLGICLAPEWQGRGVGRRLMARVLDWADNWAGVLRVELTVHADNERAIALYRSLDFLEEGRHRAYALKNGRYVDAFFMARLHPNPPRLPAAGE